MTTRRLSLQSLITLACAAMLAALIVLLVVGMVPEKASAAGKYKIVTKTFTNPSTITLPGSGPASLYPSQINVSGLRRGTVRDVNVTLRGFSHPLPWSLDFMVVHADTNRTVMSDAALPPGPFAPTPLKLVLDDEASTVLPANGFLSSQRYQPFNYAPNPDTFSSPAPTPDGRYLLKGFDGKRANGGWYLYAVDDDGFSDHGAIENGWSITIKARVRR